MADALSRRMWQTPIGTTAGMRTATACIWVLFELSNAKPVDFLPASCRLNNRLALTETRVHARAPVYLQEPDAGLGSVEFPSSSSDEDGVSDTVAALGESTGSSQFI